MTGLKSRLLAASAWQVGTNLVRVFGGLFASILMVRWFGAAEYGRAGWVLSAAMYASVLLAAGVGTPFSRHLVRFGLAGDGANRRRLLGRVIVLRLAAAALLALVTLVLAPLAPGRILGEATALVWFVPIIVLVSQLQGAVMRVLQVEFRSGTVAMLLPLEIGAKVALVWALVGDPPRAWSLLAAAAAAETLVFVIGLVLVMRMPAGVDGPAAVCPTWRHLLREGRPTWWLSLSERILGRDIDVLLLGIMAGPEAVTVYSLSFALASLGLSLLASAVQSTTSVAAHVELSAGRAGSASDSLLRIQSEFWLLLVAPLAVGGALLGGRALDLMYGEAAAGAANTCALLFGALALQQLSGLGKDALQGRGRDGVPSRAHAFGGVLNLAGSVALIPLLGAAGAAAATLAAALLTVVMQSRVLRADGHVPFAARTVRVVLVALAIMTTTVLTAGRLVSLPAAAALAVQIAAGAAAYAAVLLVLRPRSSLGSGFAAGPAPLRLVSHLL